MPDFAAMTERFSARRLRPAFLGVAGSVAGLAALLAACAPANPLIGDWVADPPSMPRSHGSLVRFREACVIVAGSNQGERAAAPVRYAIAPDSGRFWYGAPAAAERPASGTAARVSFLTPDRIVVVWPGGHESHYLRGLGPADPAPDEDCPRNALTRR